MNSNIIYLTVFLNIILNGFSQSLDQSIEIAKHFWLPQLQRDIVNASTDREFSKDVFLPRLTNTFQAEKTYLTPSNPLSTSTRLGISQSLFDLSKFIDISSKSLSLKSAHCNADTLLLNIVERVITSYHSLLYLNDQEVFLKARQARMQKVVALLEETSRLKLTEKTDLYFSQSELIQVEIQLADLANQKNTEISNFHSLLGRPFRFSEMIDKEQKSTTFAIPKEYASWAESMPQVLRIKFDLDTAKKNIASIQAEWVPSLTLESDYTRTFSGTGSGDHAATILGLFSWTLFDQNVRQDRYSREKLLIKVMEKELFAKTNELRNNIIAMVTRKEIDQKVLENAKRRIQLNEKAFESALTLLSLGKETYLTVKNSESAILEALTQWATVRRRLEQTNANLELYRKVSMGKLSDTSLCVQHTS